MSAEDNIVVVTDFHDAMEAADRERLAAMLDEIAHPDCEWTPLVTEVEGGYRGKEETLTFFADFLESFEVRYEDRKVRPVGDNAVLLLTRMALKGRGSGAAVEQEMGVLYEFEDGLLRRGRAFPSHAAAIEASEEVTV